MKPDGLIGFCALVRSVNHIRLDDSDSHGVKDSSATGRAISLTSLIRPEGDLSIAVFVYGKDHQKSREKISGEAAESVNEKISAKANAGN